MIVLFVLLIPVVMAAPINLNCDVPFDIVFVLDGSDSLKEHEFNASKKFVLDVIETLTLGPNGVQVGVLVYSTFVGGTLDLGAYNNFNVFRIFVNQLKQPRQGTATDIAIIAMKNMFDKRSVSRKDVRKIGVVLTDGRSTSPNATINAAKDAKNSGIEMFAIGYGTAVFGYELEQIASDKQNTLILTNSMTDQMFLQEFEDKTRLLICAGDTTPVPVTTPAVPTISTAKLDDNDMCPTCMKDDNFGFKPYPGDCTKYYDVSPGPNGVAYKIEKKCPFGTFWSQSVLTCEYSWKVDCIYDPCTPFTTGTLPMDEVCSGYWTCINFRSNATCCPKPNHRYVRGLGCMEDFSCNVPCPNDDSNKIIVTPKCYRYPYVSNPAKYYEENHGRNITRSCAPGTEFDPVTCSCSSFSDLIINPIQGQHVLPGRNDIFTEATSSGRLGKINVLPATRDLSKETHREKSIEFWQKRNNDINDGSTLFNGADFFNIWQADDNSLFQDFLFEDNFPTVTAQPRDSFNLWSPFNIIQSDRRQLRVFPTSSRDRVMSWQREKQFFTPDVYFDFNTVSNLYDFSVNGVVAGTSNVILNGQTASFSGNSKINIWFFSNIDFKSSLVITFNFITSGFTGQIEALVSNCIGSDVEEASILILADRLRNVVIFRTVTYDTETEVSVLYDPYTMNSVVYLYNGREVKAAVNTDVTSATLSGDIQRRQTGIILGAASHWASFNGQMDEFKLYRCLTGSFGPVMA